MAGPPDRTFDPELEMNRLSFKSGGGGGGGSAAPGSIWSAGAREPAYLYDDDNRRSRRAGRWFDQFRRDPHRRITPPTVVVPVPTDRGRGMHYYDLAAANSGTVDTGLARELKGRHLQMIAIGGSIGTGLFVASGKSLNTGGPASVLLAYGFVGVVLWCTVQALGELAVAFPVAGSFSAYSTRFLDPAWGFAMGWNYCLQWLIVLPLEIVAASMTVGWWDSRISRALWVTVFLASIVAINLLGVKVYGEAEFVFAIVKIAAVVGFILLGIVINIGGYPDGGYIGGRFWSSPGAFNNGFKGLCSVFVTAAFAFAGTELVGLAAAETVNPRKSLPTAIKQVFWRITLFYIVALSVVGLLVPYNHPSLLGGAKDASASPFVIAISSAGIQILPGLMNAVILIAVLSVGNSAVFGSSRTLAALADQRQAPSFLSYVDRRGRPLASILVAAAVGLLAFIPAPQVLDWLLAVSGLSSVLTWGSICLAHVRFRAAWAARGREVGELAFQAQGGVVASWVGLGGNLVVLGAQFWTAGWPVGDGGGTGRGRVEGFFLGFLCVPIVGGMYVAHKIWYRTRWVGVGEVDVDTGRREWRVPVLVESREREEREGWPRWKRVYRALC